MAKPLEIKLRVGGFTLVEVTIVLVIVSLLVVGILQGEDLVKQAKLRNLLDQIKNYDTAVNTFRAKYGATILPGDFDKANSFGLNVNDKGVANVAQTCSGATGNGDGDGRLEDGNCLIAKFYDGELVNFWVHLSNAKLIKETFNQIFNCKRNGTECNTDVGTGYPATPVGTGMTVINTEGTLNMKAFTYYILGVGARLFPGLAGTAGSTNSITNATLTGDEAWAIDTKLDDGLPLTGSTFTFDAYIYYEGFTYTGSTSCVTTDDDGNYIYNTYDQNKICSLASRTSF